MSEKLAVTEKEIAAFFDPLTDAPEFKDKQLGRVATMANQIVAFDKDIAEDEKALKLKKEQRRKLAEDFLPALMTEHGLTEITLSDGSKVSVKKFYSCTIPADKTLQALEWLRDNGHDWLIKHL